ncbi:hypothetical protein C8R44DRAFT_750459 [Mycena epipterygia]|nr:hypothetical protein C8R44DRAFT_750459 [Mycena epipterygia]
MDSRSSRMVATPSVLLSNSNFALKPRIFIKRRSLFISGTVPASIHGGLVTAFRLWLVFRIFNKSQRPTGGGSEGELEDALRRISLFRSIFTAGWEWLIHRPLLQFQAVPVPRGSCAVHRDPITNYNPASQLGMKPWGFLRGEPLGPAADATRAWTTPAAALSSSGTMTVHKGGPYTSAASAHPTRDSFFRIPLLPKGD